MSSKNLICPLISALRISNMVATAFVAREVTRSKLPDPPTPKALTCLKRHFPNHRIVARVLDFVLARLLSTAIAIAELEIACASEVIDHCWNCFLATMFVLTMAAALETIRSLPERQRKAGNYPKAFCRIACTPGDRMEAPDGQQAPLQASRVRFGTTDANARDVGAGTKLLAHGSITVGEAMAEPSVQAVMQELVFKVKRHCLVLLDPADEAGNEALKAKHRNGTAMAPARRKASKAPGTASVFACQHNGRPCMHAGKPRAAPKRAEVEDSDDATEDDNDDETDASETEFELDDDDDNDDMVDNDSLDIDDEDDDASTRISHGRGKRTRQERQRSHTDTTKPSYREWLEYQFAEGKRTYQEKVDFAERDIMGYLLQRQEGLKQCADVALNFERKCWVELGSC